MSESPNLKIMPASATVTNDHLYIGGCDTVELADKFGTPLWLMDEQTIVDAVQACKDGLVDYPRTKIFYAGKAFLCLAICHLLKRLGVGLDVVSEGELHTAIKADLTGEEILLHGNNKSKEEIESALDLKARIVIDSQQELATVTRLAKEKNLRARILLRIVPGITGKTHKHIQTGQDQSKFGIALVQLSDTLHYIVKNNESLDLLGLHTHIGSQIHDLQPYKQTIALMAEYYARIKSDFNLALSEIDLGGGLGIAYTEKDHPVAISTWAKTLAQTIQEEFSKHHLSIPLLLLEPGRALIGTAGITLYRVGFEKETSDGTHYVALDGGMADNPRPITYQAIYTASLANRMGALKRDKPVALAGKYCEQGDIIIKDSSLAAKTDDLIAVFGTGAYNASMASNYNRTGRPACILLSNGKAEIIIERESNADLLSRDRVPERLLKISNCC